MSAKKKHGEQGLWAITSYFNPAGFRRRHANYQIFRERLGVPLVTVEWSREAHFELQQGDADILIQISGGDVLWQKERLLNVALAAVPAACDKIAWLDCDIVFGDAQWPLAAARQLEDLSIVQLFESLVEVPERGAPGDVDAGMPPISGASAVAKLLQCTATARDIRPATNCQFRQFLPGLAWAARRDVLQHHGFYDACVVGSGDRAMLYAAFGRFDDTAQTIKLNDQRMKHYLQWGDGFYNEVRDRVGYLPGTLYHLWHGKISDRRYRERHDQFSLLDFDPYTDVALDAGGSWRWNSDKPDMHEYVRSYFSTRHEDGHSPELTT